jgi:predicted RNase H-like HicB family nuclease
MKRYLIVVEETETGYSAFSPDLPGCIATGGSRDEVEQNIQEAMRFHVDGMLEDGEALPNPHSYSSYVQIPA